MLSFAQKKSIILIVFLICIFPVYATASDTVNDVDNALLAMEHYTNNAFMDSGSNKIKDISFQITSESADMNSLSLTTDFEFTVDDVVYTGTGTWNSSEYVENGDDHSDISFQVNLTGSFKNLTLDYQSDGNITDKTQTEQLSYTHGTKSASFSTNTSIVESTTIMGTPVRTRTISRTGTRNGKDASVLITEEELIFSQDYSKFSTTIEATEESSNGDPDTTATISMGYQLHINSDDKAHVSFQKYDVTKNGVHTYTSPMGGGGMHISMAVTDVENSDTAQRIHLNHTVKIRSLTSAESDIEHSISTHIDFSSPQPATSLLRSTNRSNSNFKKGLYDAMTDGVVLGTALVYTEFFIGIMLSTPLTVPVAVGTFIGATAANMLLYSAQAWRKYMNDLEYTNELLDRSRRMDNSRTHSGRGTSLTNMKKIMSFLLVITLGWFAILKTQTPERVSGRAV